MKSPHRKFHFKAFKACRFYYCILGPPKYQWQFDYCHIWTKDNYCHAYETLSNKNQLLRYLKINLVCLKNRSLFIAEFLSFQSINQCMIWWNWQALTSQSRTQDLKGALFIDFKSRSIGYVSRYLPHVVQFQLRLTFVTEWVSVLESSKKMLEGSVANN